jgi:hypothetical protein
LLGSPGMKLLLVFNMVPSYTTVGCLKGSGRRT